MLCFHKAKRAATGSICTRATHLAVMVVKETLVSFSRIIIAIHYVKYIYHGVHHAEI